MAFSDLNNDGAVTTSEVTQQTHYYPNGLEFYGTGTSVIAPANPYKFNGILQDNDFGLNVYSAFYRTLDPVLCMWWQVDPKSDQYFHLSPYSSMENNPIMFTDPMGDYSKLGAWVRSIIHGSGGKIVKSGDGNSKEWGYGTTTYDENGKVDGFVYNYGRNQKNTNKGSGGFWQGLKDFFSGEYGFLIWGEGNTGGESGRSGKHIIGTIDVSVLKEYFEAVTLPESGSSSGDGRSKTPSDGPAEAIEGAVDKSTEAVKEAVESDKEDKKEAADKRASKDSVDKKYYYVPGCGTRIIRWKKGDENKVGAEGRLIEEGGKKNNKTEYYENK